MLFWFCVIGLMLTILSLALVPGEDLEGHNYFFVLMPSGLYVWNLYKIGLQDNKVLVFFFCFLAMLFATGVCCQINQNEFTKDVSFSLTVITFMFLVLSIYFLKPAGIFY